MICNCSFVCFQDIFYGKDVSLTGRLSLNELRNALTNTGNIIVYVKTMLTHYMFLNYLKVIKVTSLLKLLPYNTIH